MIKMASLTAVEAQIERSQRPNAGSGNKVPLRGTETGGAETSP